MDVHSAPGTRLDRLRAPPWTCLLWRCSFAWILLAPPGSRPAGEGVPTQGSAWSTPGWILPAPDVVPSPHHGPGGCRIPIGEQRPSKRWQRDLRPFWQLRSQSSLLSLFLDCNLVLVDLRHCFCLLFPRIRNSLGLSFSVIPSDRSFSIAAGERCKNSLRTPIVGMRGFSAVGCAWIACVTAA